MLSSHVLSKFILKEGEAWYEVAGELAQEGTRPITPDQECLQEILQITEQKAEEVLKKQVRSDACISASIQPRQHKLIDHQQELDLMEEQEYYSQVRLAAKSIIYHHMDKTTHTDP